jgi:hypothetical protein
MYPLSSLGVSSYQVHLSPHFLSVHAFLKSSTFVRSALQYLIISPTPLPNLLKGEMVPKMAEKQSLN